MVEHRSATGLDPMVVAVRIRTGDVQGSSVPTWPDQRGRDDQTGGTRRRNGREVRHDRQELVNENGVDEVFVIGRRRCAMRGKNW
jgi:hypothetical protein